MAYKQNAPSCDPLIMVTTTRHVFINIFQTEPLSPVKFDMGYEKNMSFLVIPKSPNVWQKVKKIVKIFLKNDESILLSKELNKSIIKQALKRFLSYWSKQNFDCFEP